MKVYLFDLLPYDKHFDAFTSAARSSLGCRRIG
jgi:hypothetical protein